MAKPDKWIALDAWIGNAQRVLGLSGWVVTVLRDAADVTAWADIEPHSQANTADLRLAHDFWRQPAVRQRLVLTHELIHLITSRVDRMVDTLEEPIGKLAFAVFEPQYSDATERMTEHLATVIAPMLPLPSLPKG